MEQDRAADLKNFLRQFKSPGTADIGMERCGSASAPSRPAGPAQDRISNRLDCAGQAAQETPGVKQEDGKPMLEILKGISGAFRPGILTSLMGVSGGPFGWCQPACWRCSCLGLCHVLPWVRQPVGFHTQRHESCGGNAGAGKTTLMDVLASRKTGEALQIPLAVYESAAIISAGSGIPTLAIPEVKVNMPASVASACCDACLQIINALLERWHKLIKGAGRLHWLRSCVSSTARPMAAFQAA